MMNCAVHLGGRGDASAAAGVGRHAAAAARVCGAQEAGARLIAGKPALLIYQSPACFTDLSIAGMFYQSAHNHWYVTQGPNDYSQQGWVNMMNFLLKTKSCLWKTRNFVCKMLNFAGLPPCETPMWRRCGLYMMNFGPVFKMMVFWHVCDLTALFLPFFVAFSSLSSLVFHRFPSVFPLIASHVAQMIGVAIERDRMWVLLWSLRFLACVHLKWWVFCVF